MRTRATKKRNDRKTINGRKTTNEKRKRRN